jgi:hypothetical protein
MAGLPVADWASFLLSGSVKKLNTFSRRTFDRMKFKVHEKQMKAQLGAAYDLSKYTEGVDYKRQKTGFGSRVIFRANILEQFEQQRNLSADHVGESADMIPVKSDLNELSADLCSQEIVMTVVDPSLVEHKQNKAPVVLFQEDAQTVIVRPVLLDGAVRTARVVKKYANQRYVETDTLGTVFVGSKGHQVKMNQVISIKNGELYLA